MPKIVRFYDLGGPDALRIEEEPLQEPAKSEVRLKVQAVGLNRAELMFMRDQYVEHPKLPGRLGYEAAGVVDAVGPDVDIQIYGIECAGREGCDFGSLAGKDWSG